MIVTAWNNGNTGYGIRLLADDRDRYFSKKWKDVLIKIVGKFEVTCKMTPRFWSTCPELRNVVFRDWFAELGYVKGKRKDWKKGNPPKFHLIQESDNCFVLSAEPCG